jgi:hypothetical protein
MDIYSRFAKVAKTEWWTSVAAMADAAEFLEAASSNDTLGALLDAVRLDPNLSRLCERLRSLDKIVLQDDMSTKTRLRLHYFKAGTYDLIHNHKWPFVSKILKGHLVQELFNSIDATSPQFVSSFEAHSTYFLSPGFFHKLRAKEQTITLVLRGPDLVSSAQWRDLNSGDTWEHVGGKEDSKKLDFDPQSLERAISNIRSVLYS